MADARLDYRPEIDGLRALAVLAVMLFHAHIPIAAGGFLGVDIFFVISGYLITRIIWGELGEERFSFAAFYERRARRILPALVVVLVVSSVAAWLIHSPPALASYGRHLVAAALSLANVAYWLDAGYFATRAEVLPLVHTWSLAIEEQFYLAFPLLLVLLARPAARRNAVAAIGLGAAGLASLLLAESLSRTSVHRDAAFYLLPTRAWELIAGAILVLVAPRMESWRPASKGPLAGALASLGLLLCLAGVFAFDAATQHPGLRTLVPVTGACLVILFAQPRTVVGKVLAWAPLVGLGLVSYSAYLWHQPMLAFARVALARDLVLAEALLILAASVAVGAASWRWVERPFRQRGAVSTPAMATLVVVPTVALCAAGSYFALTEGAPQRMDARVAATLRQIDEGKERIAGIRLGRCHYNPRNVDIETFLSRWDCLSQDGASAGVLVVGDSIAADKGWVLREAGFDVGSIGGAGCGLLPPANAGEPCWRIISKARQLVRDGKVRGLILGRNWQGAVPAQEIEAVLSYWREPGVPILVFTGTPVFRDLNERVAKYLRQGLPLEGITYDAEALAANEASMERFVARPGVTLINTRDLVCGERARPCGAFIGDQPRVGDPVHLRAAGALAMAQRVSADPVWLQWWHGLPAPPRPGARP